MKSVCVRWNIGQKSRRNHYCCIDQCVCVCVCVCVMYYICNRHPLHSTLMGIYFFIPLHQVNSLHLRKTSACIHYSYTASWEVTRRTSSSVLGMHAVVIAWLHRQPWSHYHISALHHCNSHHPTYWRRTQTLTCCSTYSSRHPVHVKTATYSVLKRI